MLQTDRKADSTLQTSKDGERAQRKQNRTHEAAHASLALEAILAGGDWDQLPADGILGLSHKLGNSALTDLFALRTTGPETAMYPAADGMGGAAPLEWNGGEPELSTAPAFGTMGPAPQTAPLGV